MGKQSPVLQRIRGRVHQLDESMQVRRVLPSVEHRAIGPFVFFDHMGPVTFAPGQAMDVRPHPHIGLSTVTYLWEGRIEHRDSLGNIQLIEPGAVNWMTAGRGIVHSERTPAADRNRGQRAHGLQLWVALPLEREQDAPSFHHVGADELPRLRVGDAAVTVVAGHAYGAESPVPVLSDMLYVDANIPAGGALRLPPEHEQRAAYVIEGEARLGDEALQPGELVVLATGVELDLEAGPDTHVVMLGGARLDAPRYVWWNYVASSRGLVEGAQDAWEADSLGRVQGDPERIPLPDKRPAVRLLPE